MSELRLNCEAAIRARLAEGLTQRALAARLGVTGPTVARFERGENHNDLSLAFVLGLADALNLRPAQLFGSEGGEDLVTGDDDVKIEAVLAEAGRLLRPEDIAGALGWKLPRVTVGLRALRVRLSTGGQRLHIGAGGVYGLRPRPGVLTDSERQAVSRAELARTSMSRPEAQLLRRCLEGGVSEAKETRSNRGRVAAAGLLKAGLVDRRAGRLVASEDLRFSLGLSDEPAA